MEDTDFSMMDCAGCHFSGQNTEETVTDTTIGLNDSATMNNNVSTDDIIQLYTTGCPQCVMLEKKLDTKKITYEKITDFDAEELTSRGIHSAPVLKVGETYLPFSLALKWVNQQR